MTETANIFSVTCTSCATSFPVDPAKVPEAGVLARCSVCDGVFRVELPTSLGDEGFSVGDLTGPGQAAPVAAEATVTAPPETRAAPGVADAPTDAPETKPSFGQRDPKEKARRLARVLVSDMITYNADRHAKALAAGTLATDFDDEIKKSWSEYVDQVGKEIAESTPYFTDALNEILAGGTDMF